MPNWLIWPVARQRRPFRVYVVEPREYNPEKHASIFKAALTPFLKPPVMNDYLLGSTHQQSDLHPHIPNQFDLLTFPEAFLPSATLLEVLGTLSGMPISLGCVHVGLRPSSSPGNADSTHLFSVHEIDTLIKDLKHIQTLQAKDLDPFCAWLKEQHHGDRFNVGCVFTVDAAQQLRICLHPKLVRSQFEVSPLHDKHMTEANLLSLVTLKPEDKNMCSVTIQPLICSDVLSLDTDQPNNHPIEAITTHRSCFPEVYSDHVDVVSVVTHTPNTTYRLAGSLKFEWHQQFRKCFERASIEDRCHRHHYAAFVLSNFRLIKPKPEEVVGGLSGVFLPLPVYVPQEYKYVSQQKAIYCHSKNQGGDSESERWINGTIEEQKLGGKSGLGYIVALDPNACRDDSLATMFGLLITRLPREANRWRRIGGVSDLCLYDALLPSDARTEDPGPQFKRRDNL